MKDDFITRTVGWWELRRKVGMDGDGKSGKLENDRESGKWKMGRNSGGKSGKTVGDCDNCGKHVGKFPHGRRDSPWENGLPWEKELVAVSTATEEEEAISGHRRFFYFS